MAKKQKPKRGKKFTPRAKVNAAEINELFRKPGKQPQQELREMLGKMVAVEQTRLQDQFVKEMNIPQGEVPRFKHLLETFDDVLSGDKEFLALLSMASHAKLHEFMSVQDTMDLKSLGNLLREDWDFMTTTMKDLKSRVETQMKEANITPETEFDMGNYGHYIFWESVIEAFTDVEMIINNTFVVNTTYLHTLVSAALQRAYAQGVVFNIEDFEGIDEEVVKKFTGKHLMANKEEPAQTGTEKPENEPAKVAEGESGDNAKAVGEEG